MSRPEAIKVVFFSESKVPFSNFPKSVPNHYPEHFLFRYIVLKIVIWHIFWEILKTHHTLWKNTTFNSSLGVTKGMATEKKYPCHMLRASKKFNIHIHENDYFSVLF